MPEHREPTMLDLERLHERLEDTEFDCTRPRGSGTKAAALLIATKPPRDPLAEVIRGLQAERYAPRHRADL